MSHVESILEHKVHKVLAVDPMIAITDRGSYLKVLVNLAHYSPKRLLVVDNVAMIVLLIKY